MINLKCIGLMSGTSMDGIDAALIETNGQTSAKQLYATSLEYDPRFQVLLKTAEYAVKKSNGDLELAARNYPKLATEYLNERSLNAKQLAMYLYGRADQPVALEDIIDHSTLLHAQIVTDLLKLANMSPAEVDVVGYHGQALYHKPADGITIQVGNGQLLADKIGITVINDFRSNDVKNGGQGAPLAPVYHQALTIRDSYYPVAVLNCGGIANITVITGADENNLIGFDTGPGNVLIDRYINIHKAEAMDKDGKYGLQGKVNEGVLKLLAENAVLQDGSNYLEKAPPKSLDPWDLQLITELNQLKFEDACATLEAFTAYTIVDSLKFIKTELPKKWLLAGGGWHNPVITAKLKEYLRAKVNDGEVMHADQIGWNSKYMEAEIFAFLAARSLQGLPLSYPQTTKARSATLGGHAYLSANQAPTHNVKQLLEKNPILADSY